MPSFCDPARVGGLVRVPRELAIAIARRAPAVGQRRPAEVSCFCFPCVRGGAAESKKVPCRKPGRDGRHQDFTSRVRRGQVWTATQVGEP